MLRMTIFGRFSLVGTDGTQIPLNSKKAKALLAYLALSPDFTRSREEIMALLWSDRSDGQARASLRQMLFGLKKSLIHETGAALNITDEVVSLDPEHIIVENASTGAELLSGFQLNDPAFEEWLRDERLRTEDDPPTVPAGNPVETIDKLSIAVLPFTNMSDDPDQEYFSDGITEDIITELSRFETLFVIARNSSFAFKGQDVESDEIGEKLGVQFIVQGSVRKSGQRLRISVQLIEVETGKHLWTERYDREIQDIFEIQDEVASRVATMVPGHVDIARRIQTENTPAKNVSAYDLILRADSLFQQNYGSAEGIQLVREALEIDPNYAGAHATLAVESSYSMFSGGLGIDEASRLTRTHGEAAVKLAPGDARIHAVVGEAYLLIGEHALAEHHTDKALSLNPNGFYVLVHAALVRAYLGDYAVANELVDRALQNDPYSTTSLRETKFEICFLAELYEEALEQLVGWPNPPLHMYLSAAAALIHLGRIEEAKSEFQKFDRLRPKTWNTVEIARSYQRMCALPEDGERWIEGFQKAGLVIETD